MIALSLHTGLKFNYRNKYLSLFASWVLITIFFNWHLPFTLTFNNRQALNVGTLGSTIHFLLGLWATFIALSYFEREDFEKIAKAICFSAVLVTVFGIMQVVGLDPFGQIAKYNHSNHFSACLDNPNIVGNYLCLSLPFFFIFKEKKYLFGGLLVILGIFLAKSTLVFICTLVGICFYAFFTYRKSIIVKSAITVLIVLLLLFCFTNKSFLKLESGFDGRLDVWQQSIEIIKENPLFGQGLGSFRAYEMKHRQVSTTCLVLHNDWLERVVEIGVLGLVLLVLIVIRSFRNFDYKNTNPLALGYLTSFLIFLMLMCGSFPVEIAPTALLGLIGFWGVERI